MPVPAINQTRAQKVLEVHVVDALRQKIRRRPRNKKLAGTIPLCDVYLWVLQKDESHLLFRVMNKD